MRAAGVMSELKFGSAPWKLSSQPTSVAHVDVAERPPVVVVDHEQWHRQQREDQAHLLRSAVEQGRLDEDDYRDEQQQRNGVHEVTNKIHLPSLEAAG